MLDASTLTITTFNVGGCLPENSTKGVRITHNPTGITVSCTRFPVYEENRDTALAMLERQVNRINKPLDK